MSRLIRTSKFIVTITILLIGNRTLACDACGCAPSMSALQVLPFFNNDMVGLHNSFSHFNHPSSSLNGNGSNLLHDNLNQSTFTYRKAYNEKLQMFYEVPFQFNTRHYTDHNEHIFGIGDIAGRLIYNSTLYKKEKSAAILRLSPRIALPTGKFMIRGQDRLILPVGIQPGTGACSIGGNIDLTFRTRNFGVQVLSSIQNFTTNEIGYQIGQRNSLGITTSYFLELQEKIVIPFCGLNHERYDNDKKYGIVDLSTGANRTMMSFGVSSFAKQLGVIAQCMIPVRQNHSSNLPSMGVSASISLMYFLPK